MAVVLSSELVECARQWCGVSYCVVWSGPDVHFPPVLCPAGRPSHTRGCGAPAGGCLCLV